jgi:hypothetical protein
LVATVCTLAAILEICVEGYSEKSRRANLRCRQIRRMRQGARRRREAARIHVLRIFHTPQPRNILSSSPQHRTTVLIAGRVIFLSSRRDCKQTLTLSPQNLNFRRPQRITTLTTWAIFSDPTSSLIYSNKSLITTNILFLYPTFLGSDLAFRPNLAEPYCSHHHDAPPPCHHHNPHG